VNTTHAPATPDVEALVFARLRDLGGITVWQTGAECPWPHVSDVASLQVDVRASSKVRARDRSYEVRQRMLRLPFDEPSVARVEVVTGPMWGPDDDGAPRYITRFAVTVRATRGNG
jgi:hypothetical protein